MHRRNGFTLIELLVVIAIIAILAAILLPVFARARENARKSTCQSNMKQMALGLMQYTQDYDEVFPHIWQAGFYCGTQCWSWQVEPYVKTYAIFRCPSRAGDWRGTTDVNGSANQLLYGMPNSNGNLRTDITGTAHGLPMVDVVEPARTFMIVETRAGTAGYYDAPERRGYGFHAPYFRNTGVNRPEDSQYYRHTAHQGGSNVAFVDGHVKWIPSGTGSQYVWRDPRTP